MQYVTKGQIKLILLILFEWVEKSDIIDIYDRTIPYKVYIILKTDYILINLKMGPKIQYEIPENADF